MWLLHERSAPAIRAKGLAVHFQSPHGVVGVLGVSLFVLNWLAGNLLFCLPCASAALRRPARGPHAFAGAASLLLCLVSILSGIVSLAGRGSHSRKDQLHMGAALLLALLVVALAAVNASPRPRAGAKVRRW